MRDFSTKKLMGSFNVLHVVSKLSASGGIGNQLLTLLKKYERQLFNPIVCSLNGGGPIAEEMESLGIEVITLGIDFKKGFYPTALKKLYHFCKEKNIHILRAHGYRSSLHSVPAGFLAKVPCIITSFHNVYMPRDRKINRRLTNKLLSLFADCVVTVSEAVKKDIIKYDLVSEKKIKVIHNGVNTSQFLNTQGGRLRNDLNLKTGEPVIGSVGRLFAQKGQRYLIEALPILKNDFPDISLIIAGEGPLRHELEGLASRLGVKDNIIFLGTRRDVPEIIALLDVFVFPSIWEGFGNALIEAMSAGKPVIASDISPVKEITNSEEACAILVPIKDSIAIAEAVKKVLNDKSKATILGESARKKVLSNFTIDITYQKYKNLYLSILNKKGIA